MIAERRTSGCKVELAIISYMMSFRTHLLVRIRIIPDQSLVLGFTEVMDQGAKNHDGPSMRAPILLRRSESRVFGHVRFMSSVLKT